MTPASFPDSLLLGVRCETSKNQPVHPDHSVQRSRHKSGRVSGLGVAIKVVIHEAAAEWGIKEQSLYGIEWWSLFRGCFTTRVYVATIRT